MGKVWSFTIPPLGPPQPPLVTVMYGLFPRETFPPTFLLEIGPGIFQVYILGTPPLPHTLEMLHNNLLIFYKLIWFTNILQPRGHREFCVWGPLQAQWRTPQTNQPLRRVQIFLWGVLSRFEGGGSPKCFLGKTLSPPKCETNFKHGTISKYSYLVLWYWSSFHQDLDPGMFWGSENDCTCSLNPPS